MPDPDELPESTPADPWAAHLPGQNLLPAYVVSRYAAQYRAVVEVLLEAQDESLTGVPFDELVERLRVHVRARVPAEVSTRLLQDAEPSLETRLNQLVTWKVLTRWQEPARTGEDFLRRRDRYQLTPDAARFHALWTSVNEGGEESAADLTLAPRAIHDRLLTFAEAIRSESYPAAAAEYQQVIVLHQGMAAAARAWQRALAHALSGGPDTEKQDMLWRTLQSYVGMWGEQVDVHSPRIAELLAGLSPGLNDQVWRACVRSALADAAEEDLIRAQAQRWTHTWTSLEGWFGGESSQARRLRRQLRDLVAPWARSMHILMDAGGTVTRRHELLRLARAVERAPDDQTAWSLWDTAVGGFAARHLMLPAQAPDAADQSWGEAAPALVTARFREQGARAAVGSRAQVADTSAGRAAARRARSAGRAARAGAEASLRARSGTRFRDWEPLTEPELDLLLELLGVVRRHRDDDRRSAVTGDGRWRITLTVPGSGPGTALLRTPRGRLITQNYLFDLEPAR